MADPLTEIQLDNITKRLESQDANATSWFLLSWLPLTPEQIKDVNMVERHFIEKNVGAWSHVELSWRPHPGPGPVSFGAWAGRWPELPHNTNFLKRILHGTKKMIFAPPEGTRGTYIAGHSFSREIYHHMAFYITAEQELNLWKTCIKYHGAGFNTSGYYWSTFWPRQTTYDKFFCSEAVLAVLQESGVLESILPSEGDETLLYMNPGAATPSILYNALAHYGQETSNAYHVVDKQALQGPSGFQFVDDSQDER